MSLAKVRKLLALAAQENEEGRTAAWMAVKLMREKGYQVTGGGHAGHARTAPPAREPAPERSPAAEPAPRAGRETRATENGRCWECRRPWKAGDPIYKPDRREPVCLECAQGESY
jgi:hypothetical protein